MFSPGLSLLVGTCRLDFCGLMCLADFVDDVIEHIRNAVRSN
jgi:hypothetical protein